MTTFNPECGSSYLGPVWAVQPSALQRALRAIQAGLWKPQANRAPEAADGKPAPFGGLSVHLSDGVLVIPITGSMQKFDSKYGGTNTVRARRAVREAMVSRDVDGVMLMIDSPGGQVAGTAELADDIRALSKVKPTATHFEDLGASAAVWAGLQTRRVSANRMAEVGSVGVYAVLEDTSKAAELEGVEVIVVSTGGVKGAYVDGAPVSDELVSEVQRQVDGIGQEFVKAIAGARKGMGTAAAAKLMTGETWAAARAAELNLIDAVESFDQAMAALRADVNRAKAEARRRTRVAQARVGGL